MLPRRRSIATAHTSIRGPRVAVCCTRTLRWKTECTRDAYAVAPTSPSFGLLCKTPSVAIETEQLAPYFFTKKIPAGFRIWNLVDRTGDRKQ